MVEHDGMVGELLKKLDDLGIADNTIVVSAEVMSWPDAASRSFLFFGASATWSMLRAFNR